MGAQIQSRTETGIPSTPFDSEAAWLGAELAAQPQRCITARTRLEFVLQPE